jgi:hypothetical protein
VTINLYHVLEGRVPPLPAIAPLRAMAKARRIASGKELGYSKSVFFALASEHCHREKEGSLSWVDVLQRNQRAFLHLSSLNENLVAPRQTSAAPRHSRSALGC